MDNKTLFKTRTVYLVAGVFAMLFSGVLYAWSILKVPFRQDFGWSDGLLALNFTATMCFFCLGAFFGSLICKRLGVRFALILSSVLTGVGFALTAFLTKSTPYLLFVSYALLAGGGIGICYNVVVSTVCAWFPDKKGFCSGCLMMGFGISTLLLGNVIAVLFDTDGFGVKNTYLVVALVLATVIISTAFILKLPSKAMVFPAPKKSTSAKKESFETRDFTTKQMLCTFTFWRAFALMTLITAVGNTVISFARDLMLSVNASTTLATTLVGVLAVFNGVGRVVTGVVYDWLGRRATMLLSNVVTIIAAAVTLLAVYCNALPLCIVGLCLTGISYGSCPTLTSAFSATFYGQKHFAVNYSITNFNLIFASFIATFANTLLISTKGFSAPFILLLALAVIALFINFTIKRPE